MKDTHCALLLACVFVLVELLNWLIGRNDPLGRFGVSEYRLLTHIGHVQIVVCYLGCWGILRLAARL